MLNGFFSTNSDWSWSTFILYFITSLVTVSLCKLGSKYVVLEPIVKKKKRHCFRVKISSLCYLIAFVILVLLATLRSYNVGPDTAVYVGYFKNIAPYRFKFGQLLTFNQMEPGFQLFLQIVRLITDDYHFLFLISYSLISFSYIRYISLSFDSKSDYVILEIFIFYYVSNMSGMRSAMGMIFLLPSFIALSEKRYIKSLLLTIVAASFHYTIAFNLIIIFLHWILSGTLFREKRWVLPPSIIGAYAVGFFSLRYIYSFISTTKYNFYHVNYDDLSLTGSLFIILLAVLIFANYKKLIELYNNENLNRFYIVISFLAIYPIIYLTGAYRVPNYYAMPRLKMWSDIACLHKRRLTGIENFFISVCLQFFVFLYLLFKFTRMAESGSFTYIL